jgi:exosortase
MNRDKAIVSLEVALAIAVALPFLSFLRTLISAWTSDPEFSYGMLIPLIVVYFIWDRRNRLKAAKKTTWLGGLAMAVLGCGLQILAGLSGSLVISGVAIVIAMMGVVGFLWGGEVLRIVMFPLIYLLFMVPLPSYLLGQLTWYLQVAASRISGTVLGSIGVPIYQDGNLLRLPNYVLEVKEACSGSRSVFSLLALAVTLGLTAERSWLVRISLISAAPILAVGANVIRIVGTGLIAWWFGSLAADESLHTAWGILVFIIAIAGLLGVQRLLRWITYAHA